ncbi:MAG: 20S proteasome subunit A/B [Verrucomicrobia bacterium]|nr:20S proteasome subunit A/B [Verrucomicrobiota bacterium]
MTEEPYRWLEAIANRREYVREQLKGGTPVFAVSRPEGILLLGVGHGHSKVFEIYNRHGFAALGHPVDIEKVRQVAIEAAHLEGFNRSAEDVTLRRLISFALSPSFKNSFEQIFSPPLIVEAIFAEIGDRPEGDVLVRLHFDGNHHYDAGGVQVAFHQPKPEAEALAWLKARLQPQDSLGRTAALCLAAWQALMEEKPLAELAPPDEPVGSMAGRLVEAALLDRQRPGPVHYRELPPWNS